ncbi:MAG: lysylphosphatidylglycerol synthase transmembrane domain-containing protein [Halanaerobacter sp.]
MSYLNEDEDEILEMGNDKEQNSINYLIYFLIFIALSSLSLYVVYKIFGANSNFSVFKSYSLSIFSSLLLLLFLYYIFDGLRLYYVLKTLNTDIDFKHIVKLVFINLFISNVTPFATGGGFVQIYFLNKKGISLGNATAATTIRTVLATMFFFIATPLIILTGESYTKVIPKETILFYISLFSILYFSFFYIVIFKNRLLKKILYNLLRFIKNKEVISKAKFRELCQNLFEEIDIFSDNLNYFLKGSKKDVLSTLISTLLFLLAEFSFSVVLIYGLGYEVSTISIIFMQVIVVFSMYFAPTPGATGVAEGSYSLLFARFVNSSDIVPLIFAWRFLTKYIGMLIGMVLFFTGFVRGNKISD